MRFSIDADVEWQVVAGVALQLPTLAIPCIYYGTDRASLDRRRGVRQFLPGFNAGNPDTDRYLREAMFGPEHPRRAGRAA